MRSLAHALLVPLLAFLAFRAAQADTSRAQGDHVQVALVAEQTTATRGRALSVGVHVQPESGWHVYWKNPGDAGQAPEVTWTLPAGIEGGDLQWPAPTRLVEGPIVTYVYESDVLLPVAFAVPADFEGTELVLRAHLRWLVCKDECVPGEATLELRLPVSDDAAPAQDVASGLFEDARRRLPLPLPDEDVEARVQGEQLEVRIRGTWPDATWALYPAAWNVLDGRADTTAVVRDGQTILSHPLAKDREEALTRFTGVAVRGGRDADAAYALDVALEGGGATATPGRPCDCPPNWTPVLLGATGVLGLAGLVVWRRRRRDDTPA